MRDVFVISDNIISPLGDTTAINFEQVKNAVSGIQRHDLPEYHTQPFYASLLERGDFPNYTNGNTKFEQLLISSIGKALEDSHIDISSKKTVLILSSTKGNIQLLEDNEDSPALRERIALHTSAKRIAGDLNYHSEPLIISNACISGSLAILMGKRLIESGQYEHAVIAGADVVSKFVLSGFHSLMAVSPNPCKPFDGARDGITLGEGAATIVLSSTPDAESCIKIAGGAVSNDANHISGPSRTGEPLYTAIQKALKNAKTSINKIGFVSAHGTATIFNDEMEAKAFTLAELDTTPTYSLKGYYGHTLGAGGIIESIISMHSLKDNVVVASAGFNTLGVTNEINICNKLQQIKLTHCLKTASGFGGCNAALVFEKA